MDDNPFSPPPPGSMPDLCSPTTPPRDGDSHGPVSGEHVKKQLNVRLLFRVAAALVVTATVVHLVHGFQVRQQARDYLRAADAAVVANDLEGASSHLSRYLAVRPHDVAAQLKYGLILDRQAMTDAARQRAYRYLELVVRRDPNNVLLRQTLAHLAVRLGRFADAARHLQRLRSADVDRAELEQTLAWCYLGSGDRERAVQCFSNAIRLAPDRVVNYVQLAELWLRLDQPGQARRVMDDLIAANRQSAAAFAARARYFQAVGRPEDASSDMARALRLAPASADILLQAAWLADLRDHPGDARGLLLQGLKGQPGDGRFAVSLARLEQDTSRRAEAVAVLRRGGEQPEILALLGELLLEQGDTAGAETVAGRLRRAGPSDSPWSAYLDALMKMQRGDWVTAARRLEGLRARLPRPVWEARVQLGLARCYEACGDPRWLGACRRALALEVSRRAQFALGQALSAARQLEEAARVWQGLMRRPEAPAAGWLEWAEALLRRQAARPPSLADWTEPRSVLLEAERTRANPVRAALLRAEFLLAQGQRSQARDLLRLQAAQRPLETALAAGLADLTLREGNPYTALALLSEVRGRPGAVDGADWRLIQVRCVLAAGPSFGGGARALEEAGRGLERLPAGEQRRVCLALVASLRDRGDAHGAAEICRRWCRRLPFDLTARLALFDLAAAANADETLRELVADMHRIEGEEGVCWRCGEVMRLLGGSGQRPALAAARKLLNAAAGFQPGWSRVAALTARLDEIEGRPERALDNYLKAFDQGDRHAGLAEHLVQLLLQRQRFVDVARVVRVYQQEAAGAALTPALARLGCEAAQRLRDHPWAAELARLAVAEDARDYRDHLWLAGVLESAGRPPEAERVLERLTATSGDIADTWVALLRHLVRVGRWGRVGGVLERARARLGADERQGAGLARCFEAAARVEEAEQTYRKAVEAAPDDPLLRSEVARFYLFHDRPEEALPHLRAVVAAATLPDHVVRARRMLATLPFQLAVLGRSAAGVRLLSEAAALRLLAQNRRALGDTVADQRARALVVAADRRRLGEALRLFEDTLPQPPASADEQFRQAQLCDLAGDSGRAARLMLGLLDEHKQNGQYLAGQVRLLLAQGDRPGARRWLKRLEKVEPDTPRSRSLREALR